jgi:hypothetical protein
MNSDMLFRHHYSGVVKDTVKIRYLMFEIINNDIQETNLMRGIFKSLTVNVLNRQVFMNYFRLTNSVINIDSTIKVDKLEVTSRILEEL